MSARSKTRYAVLGMLSFESKSGYDIKKEIEEGFSIFWSESFGQIYKVLKQLVSEKLIEKKHIRQKGRPSKDLYSITETGIKELKNYLAKPPEKLVVRDEMILKLIFGFHVPRKNTIKLLEHELHRLNKRIENIECRADKKLEESPLDEHTKMNVALTIKRGKELVKTKIRWCKDAIKLFSEIDMNRKSNSKIKEVV